MDICGADVSTFVGLRKRWPTPDVSRHGVNQAEALKSEALTWRVTGDDSDKQSTVDRIDMLYKYHGRASGMLQTITSILKNADHAY